MANVCVCVRSYELNGLFVYEIYAREREEPFFSDLNESKFESQCRYFHSAVSTLKIVNEIESHANEKTTERKKNETKYQELCTSLINSFECTAYTVL